MIGKTLSHYRILAPLGAGGMGVVYRARDERLEREVALKLLPAGLLAEEKARRRFKTNARVASKLVHPRIATVFDFDSDGGTDFLVMELVPGETLEARLRRGSLSESEVLAIGAQVAEALEFAHGLGILHRDIKPANIMISAQDHVKVLDFGLAYLLRREGERHAAESSVDSSSFAGTLPYLAPEEIAHSGLSERSDLYSLGVVLYELATGRHPHAELQGAALIYAIVNTSPPFPRQLRPELSSALEAVILRTIEKDPARRPASARELGAELRGASSRTTTASRTAQTPPRIESLAVLPLKNLSADPAQEFFADGMTEALIARLAQIGALRVISRTSAMQYRGARKTLPEIARELRVDAVLEGAVLRAGERVRISAQLIEAATERNLWACSYERDFGDVLALQAEVARAIAEEIRVRVTPEERVRLDRAPAIQPRAFEAYLRGRFLWNQRTRESLERSIEHFQQAIIEHLQSGDAADRVYALAYSGLADAYNILGVFRWRPPAESFARARAAAHQALETDPLLAEGHASLAFPVHYYDWDFETAERGFHRAIELNPGYATAHQWYSELLVSLGRFGEGLLEAERALEVDPLSPPVSLALADVHFYARDYPKAIEALKRTLELDPSYVNARMNLGRTYEQLGRFKEAIAEFERGLALTAAPREDSPALAHVHALAGDRAKAEDALPRLFELEKQAQVSPYSIANVYVALGEMDQALHWLEKACEERDRMMVSIKVHPRLDRLRGDPRFEALLRRVGLTP